MKWAGGKRALVPAILAWVPRAVATYYEPFLGGGALFFALAGERPPRFRRAVLSDANAELIACYQALRDVPGQVIEALGRYDYSERSFYSARDGDSSGLDPAGRAARTIFLNRAGFNGLYRVNSQGRFNVPFGRHKRPTICDPPRLLAVSRALQGVELAVQDFVTAVAGARPGDFVYFDPPYVPVSATSSFTAYARGRFHEEDQVRLAARLRGLREERVAAVLSNSDCPVTRRLYRGLPVRSVLVRRAINAVATRRGVVGELLVRSLATRAAR